MHGRGGAVGAEAEQGRELAGVSGAVGSAVDPPGHVTHPHAPIADGIQRLALKAHHER